LDKFVIKGGFPLKGKLRVNGAKNATLPILAACLLTEGKSHLENVPCLTDIVTMCKVLEELGVKVERENKTVEVDSTSLSCWETPYDLVKLMRASILVLGPLLARCRRARVSLPGGCNIGARPVDLHLEGLKQLGASIEVKNGYIEARVKKNLRGANIYLDVPSVGATENIMFAATLAKGTTLIKNPSCDPEVIDVVNFLKKMGAHIEGEGTDIVRIDGVKELSPASHSVIPDRIEAGTLLMAAVITRGEVILERISPNYLRIILDKLRQMGAEVDVDNYTVRVKGDDVLKPIGVKTLPYPGFSTDLQPQMTTVVCLARGTSTITETIFESRFTHIAGLKKMGAQIKREKAKVEINGVSSLRRASVTAPDIRGGAALILAGLAAEGMSEVKEINHVDRGYEKLEEKLSKLGARIERMRD
jgi:UDP-N-acetylglucosamine 1-carboxyvinyltransferase